MAILYLILQRIRSTSEYRLKVGHFSHCRLPYYQMFAITVSYIISTPPMVLHLRNLYYSYLPSPSIGVPASDVLKKGLEDLHNLCDHIVNTFKVGHFSRFIVYALCDFMLCIYGRERSENSKTMNNSHSNSNSIHTEYIPIAVYAACVQWAATVFCSFSLQPRGSATVFQIYRVFHVNREQVNMHTTQQRIIRLVYWHAL